MLTPIEQSKLAELETVIERNLTAFYEVGNALLQMTVEERAALGIPNVEEILSILKEKKPCLTLLK